MIIGYTVLHSQPYGNYLLYDKDLSPYAGGETILTLHHLLENSQDILFNASYPRKSWLSRLGRATQLILLWNLINDTAMITQHEVFGHGYRLRDIGKKYVCNMKYEIDPSIFFGEGETLYDQLQNLSSSIVTAIALSGIEGTAILSHQLKIRELLRRKSHPQTASLYLTSFHDLTIYSLISSKIKTQDFESDDLKAYVFWLHQTYPSSSLSLKKLRNLSLLNLLDPLTYFATYGWLKYIFSGKNFHYPLISINDFRYLPNTRIQLTPFGPELSLENYLQYKDDIPLYFYLKGGTISNHIHGGLGLEYHNFFHWEKGSVGFQIDTWLQPKILWKEGKYSWEGISFGYDHKEISTRYFGMALSLFYEYFASDSYSFLLKLGGKSKGFLEGESLRQALIAQLGLGLNF